MSEWLFGWENEYAFRATDGRARPAERTTLLHSIQPLIMAKYPALVGPGSGGMFLANGGRMYVDCGMHQEWCTPECANPWDVVRYLLAGEKLLAEAVAEALVKARRTGEAAFFRCNVDYSGTGSTWGAHESILHRYGGDALVAQLVPFLVSRIVITGAGGFDPASPCRFTLSPRVGYLRRTVSPHSTHDRGIFHTKDEPLASAGYHRLHIICGESLNSHLANWLKAGTTVLAVALAEAGFRPGDAVALQLPLRAMRRYADDPTCTAVASTKSRTLLTAISIQRHYLQLAEAHLRDAFMPPWAEEVTRRWRELLDRLSSGIDAVSTTLDWAIKLRLFQRHAQRRGIPWESLRHWNNVLTHLVPPLAPLRRPYGMLPVDLLLLRHSRPRPVFTASSPSVEQVRTLQPMIERKGLSIGQLADVLKLRAELLEIDLRFGELGSAGLFNVLDQAGVLDHRVAGVDNIEHAVANPPQLGRARIRGEAIRRLSPRGSQYSCDWSAIYSATERRMLDLSEPWTAQENWKSYNMPSDSDVPDVGFECPA